MKRFLALLCVLLLIVPSVAWTDEVPEDFLVEAETIYDEETPPDETETPPVKWPLLNTGSKGADVIRLQSRLIELGFLDGEADGDYGAATRSAVRRFQTVAELDADGIAGQDTQSLLYSDAAPSAPLPQAPVDVLATDLPILVNKEFPIQDGFMPADLVNLKEVCDPKLVKIKYDTLQGVKTAVDALITMLEAAKADGITRWQVSAAYRSYETQESLLNSKINSYRQKNPGWSRSKARSAALKTVAEPGASEHHLGLSFDVNVPGTDAFLGTKQCTWLHAHCWEYGFIIRYQKGKENITGFSAEAWHIRYVGTEHSYLIRDNNFCLEEYLDWVESNTEEVLLDDDPE